MLYRLAEAFRRRGNRLLEAIDGGDRHWQKAIRDDRRRQAWAETARAQCRQNAAAVQSDLRLISDMEQVIGARIDRPVRHVRSRSVPWVGSGAHAHAQRRAYTKHWFEVSGAPDDKLTRLLDSDGLLGVFVKSGLKLGLSPQLERILSEQGGNGFRVPYFFGSFTTSGLKIGVWEAVKTEQRSFQSYTFEEQARIVEAIAAANAVQIDGAVPVMSKWVTRKPRRWYESRYRSLEGEAHVQWKDLYARTQDVMRRHHGELVRRLWSTGKVALTHNDVGRGNIFVQPTGDVVVYDWELSTLSPPGADLGVLAPADSSADLVSCYLSRMAQSGVELDADAVRFTVDVVEGHRAIHTGWHRRDPGRVEKGLALLRPYLHD